MNITNRYELDKGQREQFYDYSRIVRRVNFPPATRKVLVVFDKYVLPSNDTGDFYTVASYDEERFSNDIPLLKDGDIEQLILLILDQEFLLTLVQNHLSHLKIELLQALSIHHLL